MLALLFIVSLPAVTARLYASDEVEYFSYLRSLYFDQDVSFDNEYRYFYDHHIARSAGFHDTFLVGETAVGHRVNYATVGASILWLPFFALADVWTRATGAAEANGMTQPYITAVAYGSAFYGFLAILLSARAAGIVLGGPGRLTPASATGSRAAVFWPTLAIWIGTPLLFYMYVAPPFAHACSAFAVALFVNLWLHVRRRWTIAGACGLGLSAALMTMVREQDAFIGVGPAVDFLWAHRSSMAAARHGLAAAATGITATALGYAPQLAAYTALNGYPGPAEHVARKMYWTSPWALSVLVSPQHGFFFWTPLAVLSLAGLFLVRERIVALALGLMALSQVYVAGSVASWTVAGAFGQRRFVCLTVVLVIGLSALWTTIAGAREARIRTEPARGTTTRGAPAYALAVIVLLGAWWNVALMAQFATRLMDRQRLEPVRNAYHAFVTLPLQGPSLAYRYITDRSSFYDSGPAGADR